MPRKSPKPTQPSSVCVKTFTPEQTCQASERDAAPRDLVDVLLLDVARRSQQADPPPPYSYTRPSAHQIQMDQTRSKMVRLLQELGLRRWTDVVAYMDRHGFDVEGWASERGLALARLADWLELAQARDRQSGRLSDPQRNALEALDDLKAYSSDTRADASRVAKSVYGTADANLVAHSIAELKNMRLVETKQGRGGGCWLTPEGRALISSVRGQ
jgi:hypothetical protein